MRKRTTSVLLDYLHGLIAVFDGSRVGFIARHKEGDGIIKENIGSKGTGGSEVLATFCLYGALGQNAMSPALQYLQKPETRNPKAQRPKDTRDTCP